MCVSGTRDEIVINACLGILVLTQWTVREEAFLENVIICLFLFKNFASGFRYFHVGVSPFSCNTDRLW